MDINLRNEKESILLKLTIATFGARILIASVWLVNGLYCKVLNLVPRHQQIVGEILTLEYARPLTLAIGLAEIIMAGWILSNYRSRFNVITQILVIGVMNVLEFFLVPHLLLWGRWNLLFALLFIGVIYLVEFKLKQHRSA